MVVTGSFVRYAFVVAFGSALVACSGSSSSPLVGDGGTDEASTGGFPFGFGGTQSAKDAGASPTASTPPTQQPQQPPSQPGATCGVDGTSACITCMRASCCQLTETCVSDVSCASLLKCLSTCAAGDTTCENACGNQYPNGVTPFLAWGKCIEGSCATACQ
jgi:hypothetical protein